MILDPEVFQSVANCPRSCSFYENTAELTLPNPFIESVDAQTGVVSFASASSHLDGSAFPMLIVCESLESTLDETKRVVFDRFTVNFQVDCTQDQIEFVQDYAQVDFYIPNSNILAPPPDPLHVNPILSRSHPSCPIECKVTSSFFSYQQPSFVQQMDPATGSFVILTDDKNYIGKSFTTEIKCTSLISEDSTSDSFEIFFREESDTAGPNPA